MARERAKSAEATGGLVFTGERVVPGRVESALWEEHVSRYTFAAGFVRGKTVLDFACGSGYGAALLRSAGADRVLANDVAPEALCYAAEDFSAPGTTFVAADCLATPFRSEQIDVIVSFEAIEHVASHQRFLAEARRLLKPDGLLILSTPNRRTYSDESGRKPNPYHVRELYLDELREALSDHFSGIKILGQSTVEGTLLTDISPQEGGGRQGVLLDQHLRSRQSLEERAEQFDFFLAVCSVGRLPEALTNLPNHLYPGRSQELRGLRMRHRRLQREFDDRTRWLQNREQRLLANQGELSERTRWALALDTRVAERDATIYELQARLDEAAQRARGLNSRLDERNLRIAELEARLKAVEFRRKSESEG